MHPPPVVHVTPPDIIHVMSVSRPSPFFTATPLLVYYITKEQEAGDAWKRGYSHDALVEKVFKV